MKANIRAVSVTEEDRGNRNKYKRIHLKKKEKKNFSNYKIHTNAKVT